MAVLTVDPDTGETSEVLVDKDVLTRPFPQGAVRQRPGAGGKPLSYVDGTTVIHRLIEATDNTYSFSVEKYWSQDGARLALVTLTIPGMGSRSHIGVQAEDNRSGEDALAKGAITDGLKKAATLFGVGLELYGPDRNALPDDPVPATLEQRVAAVDQQQARRMASIGNGPAPQRQDPASIPGVTRGLPQRQAVNATASPASTEPYPYAKSFPATTKTAEVIAYLRQQQIAVSGDKMGDAIKAANAYAREVHGAEGIVVGSGEWDDQYKQFKVYPADIGNAVEHYIAIEAAGGARAAADRDTTNEGDFDDIPF